MSENDFEFIAKLGQGSFGEVYKVKRRSDGKLYAMKRVKITNMKQKDKNNALNEIRLLASIQHHNIISYNQAFYDESTQRLCTVMELAPNGDLSNRIKQKYAANKLFKEDDVWKIGYQLLEGLNALHQAQILHRDLKPANIFFGFGDVAKIGDMNVSRLIEQGFAKTQIGTPYYASPQVWSNQHYGYECDVWSFGCIMYQICTFKPPFRGKNIEELYKKINKGKYQPIQKYSKQLTEAIDLCLKIKDRGTIKQLLQMFQKHCPSKNMKNESKSVKLLDIIRFPADFKQFAKILPKPKYKSEKCIILKKVQKIKNILDVFKRQQAQKDKTQRQMIRCVRSQKVLPGLQEDLQAKYHLHVKKPKLANQSQAQQSLNQIYRSPGRRIKIVGCSGN